MQPGGKKLRPRLVYGLGQALELDSTHLVGWAAAGEILHNATLVHDDLQDGDHWRRGMPTVWKKYGAAQAVNLGDFLIMVSAMPVLMQELGALPKGVLTTLLVRMATQIVNGQSFEPIVNELNRIDTLRQDYFKCISQKTSAFFAGIGRGVALIGKYDLQFQEQLEGLFLELGTVFQIQDDILDLFGNKQRKATGCDIREGKVSFLVVTHLSLFRRIGRFCKPCSKSLVN